jgi:type III secretory pathway component EscT
VLDAAQGIASWLLVAARVAPSLLVIVLVLGARVPLWLGLGCSLAIAAGLSAGLPAPAFAAGGPALSAGLRELIVGACFASAALLPLLVLRPALSLVEGPAPGERTPWSALYALAAAALLISLGGPRAYVRALSESLVALPLASPSLARGQVLLETQAIVTQAFALAASFALPLLAALWLLDLCLALVLRVAHAGGRLESSPLRRALLVLLLSLLCAPLVSRAPELTRAALGAAGALLPRLAP